ncbi:MAG: MCE family protein, partial [Mycobacterium sp.]
GVPLDDRVTADERIFAPVEGTPLPPGAVPAGTPPDAPGAVPPPPGAVPSAPAAPAAPYIPPPPPGNSINGVPVPPVDGAIPAAPSGYAGSGPSVAMVPYDPRTGRYMSASGQYEQQTNLIAGSQAAKSWKDLMPT